MSDYKWDSLKEILSILIRDSTEEEYEMLDLIRLTMDSISEIYEKDKEIFIKRVKHINLFE
jgi:hypothetical protein